MPSNNQKLSARCPVRTTLELVGGKWKLLIIQQLGNESFRLSEIRKSIPDISEKMLIQELKYLLQNHMVERINFGEVPPRVNYRLTEKGKLAFPLIQAIQQFGLAYHDAM